MIIDVENLTIKEAHKKLIDRDFSAVELTRAALKLAKERDGEVDAYLEFFEDSLEQAKFADELIAKGDASMLTGIPIAIKDNILINGKIASAGSKILEGYVSTYNAGVIKKLKERGVVFIGRTNMDEFAMGSSTETSFYKQTKNPHDLTRVPGGSSGGSAVAVAVGVLGSLGSDTGGSIRQPASFCGVVGLKPTYGAVSRSGLMAMASSLDQIGPFAKTVADAEFIFDSIKGSDDMDSTSNPNPEYKKAPEGKLTIGVPYDFIKKEGVDKDVLKNFEDNIEELKKAGHKIKEIKLPNAELSLAAYYIIMPAEASTNLARFDGVRYGLSNNGKDLFDDYAGKRGDGFGVEVRRRILLGAFVLSSGYYDAYYNKANLVREHIKQDYKKAFDEVDVIATPTTPSPAFKIGENTSDPLKMYLADIFTVPINLAGVPAISVPCGAVMREGNELPLGMQFIAPHFGEKILFTVGKVLEEIRRTN